MAVCLPSDTGKPHHLRAPFCTDMYVLPLVMIKTYVTTPVGLSWIGPLYFTIFVVIVARLGRARQLQISVLGLGWDDAIWELGVDVFLSTQLVFITGNFSP
eukprot:SAG22_NODE_21_length_31784_cov_15.522897_3_plen_101_part_00